MLNLSDGGWGAAVWCENRLLMYSSNHLVRDCSILNIHIIITQSLLPNQSKHMDMFLRELRVYYAGRLVRTSHTQTHTHACREFPKVKQMLDVLSQQEISSRWWGRRFLSSQQQQLRHTNMHAHMCQWHGSDRNMSYQFTSSGNEPLYLDTVCLFMYFLKFSQFVSR